MSKSNNKSKTKQSSAVTPARPIGPEDLAVGDYVTIVRTTHEFVSHDCDWKSRVEPTRVTLMSYAAGWPLKVVAVAVPFAVVVDADGDHFPIDTRRHELARVRKRYGRAAFKSVSKAKKSS